MAGAPSRAVAISERMRLIVTDGPARGTEVALDATPKIIGRSSGADICLAQPGISRQHARVVVRDGAAYIEDLQSRNGTIVNGARVSSPHQLRPGDEIRIGPCLLRFESPPAAPPAAPFAAPRDATIVAETAASSSNEEAFRENAAYKLRAVMRLTESLARSLDTDEIVSGLPGQLFQLFPQADRASVMKLREGVPIVAVARERNSSYSRPSGPSRAVLDRVVGGKVGVLAENTSQDPAWEGGTLHRLGVASFMVAPLLLRGSEVWGMIQLERLSAGSPFVADDLHLLTVVALEVSVVLDNARQHQELLAQARLRSELEFARAIQKGFLPQEPPALPAGRFDFHGRVEPAVEMAGDYYDYFPASGGRLAMVVADVSGKGMAAALFLSVVRTLLRHMAPDVADPGVLLQRLNNALTENNPTGMFVTLALCVLAPETGEITLARCGHPTPLLRRLDGSVIEVDLPQGQLLGFDWAAQPFPYRTVPMDPGETLCLYSDGITEAHNKVERAEFYGLERFKETLAGLPAQGSLDSWATAIRAGIAIHTGTDELADDVTTLLFRRR